MPISSYEDDPFVEDARIKCMVVSSFRRGADGRPLLSGDWVDIDEETVIYRQDGSGQERQGDFKPFATNPWPCIKKGPASCGAPTANGGGDFVFPDEPRFPRHDVERDANGKPLLDKDGLQVWKPRDLHRGWTTAFEAANAARDAAEFWSGRELHWGENSQLAMNAHAFIDFNAFYSPSARMLFFGVVPYRLTSDPQDMEHIKLFELSTSWEVAAHESGHALHHVLKPNADVADLGFHTWGESFADQMAMFASLRDADRTRALLAGTGADLSKSNRLSAIGESFAALTGQGTGLRDAVNDKRVSNTSDEQHDRSEVLTGAVYRLFLFVYGALKQKAANEEALAQAGTVMGTFLARAADYSPENQITLKDVAKAYLKVDKEFLGGTVQAVLVDEFVRRELFDSGSLAEWLQHEAAVPQLQLARGASQRDVESLVQANLRGLGIGPGFGLTLQSIDRDKQLGQTIVRVQLTEGRGAGSKPLDNHGVLVFRADGTLADYHAPLPATASQGESLALIAQARQLALDRRGALLSVVRKLDGQQTVEARAISGGRMDPHVDAFTLENPRGERREILPPKDHGWGKRRRALLDAGVVIIADEVAGK